jgi:hypothetical protein
MFSCSYVKITLGKCAVNNISDYTFWALYRSYFKGTNALEISNCKCLVRRAIDVVVATLN